MCDSIVPMHRMNTATYLSGLVVLGLLLGGVVLRGRFPKVPIWSVMILSASLTLLLGLVGMDEALQLIDMDVIMLLIGMFALVGMAEHSGLLDFISSYFLSKVRSTRTMLIVASLLFGLMSAFFVNDTVALMGPPIAVLIGKSLGGRYEAAILLLCLSITIGSVMTPIGNPQNILIALQSGMKSPFIEFLTRLAAPTLLSLIITPLIINKLYKIPKEDVVVPIDPWETVRSRKEFYLALFGGSVTVAALIVNDVLAALGQPHITSRGLIPFVSAAALWILTDTPREILSRVDFGTILFFLGMFITVEGVWRSQVLSPLFSMMNSGNPAGPMGLLQLTIISLVMSQLISNVPFTKLAIQQLRGMGVGGHDVEVWLTLAASSTLAGGITVLGAASNVIVLEVLESRYGQTIPYLRFAKIGLIVTAVSLCIYLPFLIM
uniref:Citrate transporter n=2 Tax=Caldiarchaeum subterraneum TaxID=311458 RepID=E6NAW0_CALS0|nr:citrate transporter [Candidatus Caldarchaeum subterraneum]